MYHVPKMNEPHTPAQLSKVFIKSFFSLFILVVYYRFHWQNNKTYKCLWIFLLATVRYSCKLDGRKNQEEVHVEVWVLPFYVYAYKWAAVEFYC